MTVMDKIRVRDGPKGKSASGGQTKIANPGLPIQDCQSKIAHPGLPIQDCQSKVANPRLPILKTRALRALNKQGILVKQSTKGRKRNFGERVKLGDEIHLVAI